MIAEIDAAQFDAEVLASPVPVLVEFFTPLCGLCHQMLPMLGEVAAERADRLNVVKCNAEKNAEFAARFRINAVPNLILFSHGEPIGQRVGRITKREVLAWVDEAGRKVRVARFTWQPGEIQVISRGDPSQIEVEK